MDWCPPLPLSFPFHPSYQVFASALWPWDWITWSLTLLELPCLCNRGEDLTCQKAGAGVLSWSDSATCSPHCRCLSRKHLLWTFVRSKARLVMVLLPGSNNLSWHRTSWDKIQNFTLALGAHHFRSSCFPSTSTQCSRQAVPQARCVLSCFLPGMPFPLCSSCGKWLCGFQGS